MKTHIIIFALFFLIGCSSKQKNDFYDYGVFEIRLPKEPKTESLNSIDSYAAKINFDSTSFGFDYGRYSPKMTLSPKEYLDNKEWETQENFIIATVVDFGQRDFVRYDSLGNGQFIAIYSVNDDTMFRKIAKDKILLEKSDIEFDGDTLKYRFKLPEKLQEFDFYLSEDDSVFSRIFVAKDFTKYRSGKYILDKESCTNKLNCLRQLSIWTYSYGKISKEELLGILKSVKLKKN